jgi:hypothetical protein
LRARSIFWASAAIHSAAVSRSVRQLIVVDVVQLVFGEAEQENRPQLRPESDQHPVAASHVATATLG